MNYAVLSLTQEHLDKIDDDQAVIFELFPSRFGSLCKYPRFTIEEGYQHNLICLDEEVKRYLDVGKNKVRRTFR